MILYNTPIVFSSLVLLYICVFNDSDKNCFFESPYTTTLEHLISISGLVSITDLFVGIISVESFCNFLICA